MPGPSYITGRNILATDGTAGQGRFFSDLPAATPKYALNAGPRKSEFVETMARLIVDIPDGLLRSLLRSLPGDTAAAAQTLLYSGDLTSIRNGSASGAGYFDFLLTQVTQQQQEREQAVDTLTDNTVIFYSGQSAPILSCSGYFLNTFQDDQNVWFQLLYSDILRGTQLARRGIVSRFRYDSFFVSGYLKDLTVMTQGGAKDYVQFSFNFRVKEIQVATPIIYNPTLAQSLLTTSIFESADPPGADNVTRRGLETAEQPAAPLSVPAAATDPGVDARAVVAEQGTPPRERQAIVDRTITVEIGAVAEVTQGSDTSQLDAAATPVVGASGDTFAALDPETRALFQQFNLSPTAPTSGNINEILNIEAAVEQQLRAADTRGTVLISPIDGAPTRTSAYADTVARAAPIDPKVRRPGTGAAPALDAASEDALDVYRPPPRLLQELLKERGSVEQSGQRTRQRSTP